MSTKNILKAINYQEQTIKIYTKVENKLTNRKMFDTMSI